MTQPVDRPQVEETVIPGDGARDAQAARALFDHCFAELAYYKAPGWIVFTKTLPTTATQKVRQDALQQLVDQAEAGVALFDFRDRKKRH